MGREVNRSWPCQQRCAIRTVSLVWALAVVAYAWGPRPAAGQDVAAIHPASSSVVYQTMPYFQWPDAVPYPYEGSYRITIVGDDAHVKVVDRDVIPACINHYSSMIELEAGRPYSWQVEYVSEQGEPRLVVPATEFTIRKPAFVMDVETTDTFNDIVAKLNKAKATSSQGAMLRFPPKHTFHLAQALDDSSADQESGEGVLLNASGASNLIIDGRGSKIILRAYPLTEESIKSKTRRREGRPEKTVAMTRGCGFFFAVKARHIQVKDLTLDYENDSLMQYAGQITGIDPKTHEITTRVDARIYGNFEEMKRCKDVYFVDAKNHQRIGNQGVAYPMSKSWQESALGDGRFQFQVGEWGRFGDELKIGDWAVSSQRGGDAFVVFNGCEDIVINNCRVEGCRGRYFIVKHPQPNIRCINNRFVRTGGRIMGAPSGGVNNHGDFAWYQNCVFEFTRDDSFHAGEAGKRQQTVLRNCSFRGAFRNTVWMHDNRCWIEGNQLFHCGITGINLSGAGLGGGYNTIDVGIIRNNLISDANKTSFEVHGDASHLNRHLLIEGNVVRNNRMNQAFLLGYVADSLFASNRVESTTKDWRVYSIPELQLGANFDHCTHVSGTGNTFADPRLDRRSWLKVEDSCSQVEVSVGQAASPRTPN